MGTDMAVLTRAIIFSVRETDVVIHGVCCLSVKNLREFIPLNSNITDYFSSSGVLHQLFILKAAFPAEIK